MYSSAGTHFWVGVGNPVAPAWPGLEPRLLNPGSSALTIRPTRKDTPPRLSLTFVGSYNLLTQSVRTLVLHITKELRISECTFASTECGFVEGFVQGLVQGETLKSPGYPNNYPSNIDCRYLVQIPFRGALKVVFFDFDVQDHPSCG